VAIPESTPDPLTVVLTQIQRGGLGRTHDNRAKIPLTAKHRQVTTPGGEMEGTTTAPLAACEARESENN